MATADSTLLPPHVDHDELVVSRIRALRGPNYWRLAPVIACDVRLGSLEEVSSAAFADNHASNAVSRKVTETSLF